MEGVKILADRETAVWRFHEFYFWWNKTFWIWRADFGENLIWNKEHDETLGVETREMHRMKHRACSRDHYAYLKWNSRSQNKKRGIAVLFFLLPLCHFANSLQLFKNEQELPESFEFQSWAMTFVWLCFCCYSRVRRYNGFDILIFWTCPFQYGFNFKTTFVMLFNSFW
jgi:hypothetical protein